MLLRTCLLLTLLPLTMLAQNAGPDYYLSNTPRFLNKFNDTLPNAFAGGLRNPQVYNIDLDKDGQQDLVVFDGRDGSILPFEARNEGEDLQYTYAPAYKAAFPKSDLFEALKVRDYNDDGRNDLFYNQGGGIAVYKQTADSNLQFTLAEDELMARDVVFCPDTCSARVFTPPTDIPGITDVDNDGDLDILTFSSSYLTLYRNLAKEQSKNTLDSLNFELTNACFGSFRESGAGSDVPDINFNCPGFRRTGKKHAGANIMLFDKDKDGDQDMLYGDVGFRNIVYLANGKSDNTYPIDTFTSATKKFPKEKAVDLKEFPAAFRPEISGDSLKDLLVTPQEEVNGRVKDQLWYYVNTGTKADPQFTFQSNDILQNTMVDLGGGTAPTFLDFDGDGVKDLLVAANQNTNNGGSFLVLYKNEGTDKKPVYKVQNRDYLGLKDDSLLLQSVAAGDLNQDNATDLVIGTSKGRLHYYQNQSNPGEQAQFTLKTRFLDSIDVGRGSSPAIADINGDGYNDLIVGSSFQNLFYYRQNKPNSGNPTFTKVTDTLGGIQQERFSFLRPAVADLDGNGSLDLVLGTRNSGLKFYYNFQSAIGKKRFKETSPNIKFPSKPGRNVKQIGQFLIPTIHSQGTDTFPDLYLGNARGGLVYLGTQSNRDTVNDVTGREPTTKRNLDYKLYPNPASNSVNLEWQSDNKRPGPLTLRLWDLKGHMIKSRQLNSQRSSHQFEVNQVKPGVYITTLQNTNGKVMGRERLIITP